MSDSNKKKRGKRSGLGRGLKNLIPDGAAEKNPKKFIQARVEDIAKPPSQPRKDFDEEGLAELAASIEESGLIQPLVVRQKGDDFELIAGERRLRACKLAEIEEVPVVIKDVSDAEAYALALVENIQREDLNPIEEATAYERIKENFEYTQAELAEHLGKSRSAIANSTRLLQLPTEVKQMVAAGQLSSGHARVLVPLSDENAAKLAEKIIDKGLSVRKAEKAAKRLKKKEDEDGEEKPSAPPATYREDAHTRDITRRLQSSLGTKVKLKDRHGKGKVEIHYEDYDVLQSVLDRILEEQ